MAIPHWQGGMGRESRATSEPRAVPGTRNLWAVVPAGGSGSRLWPLSRAARPKFLLPLLGERSLLQKTIDRLAPSVPPERTLVVCGPAHAAPVARQLPALPERNVLVEPSPRGSGPAITLATALIARRDPAAIVGSFAADHEVSDLPLFDAALRTAVAAAEDGWLVTIGMTPTRPETGYGYIERTDDVVAETPEGSAYRAARFVEKPDAPTAAEYVASGRFLWNASMFVWQAARCSTKWRGFSRTCTLASSASPRCGAPRSRSGSPPTSGRVWLNRRSTRACSNRHGASRSFRAVRLVGRRRLEQPRRADRAR